MRIVETDNYGGDDPAEKFVNLPCMTQAHAQKVADAINRGFPPDASRFWKVVDAYYRLHPGFGT